MGTRWKLVSHLLVAKVGNEEQTTGKKILGIHENKLSDVRFGFFSFRVFIFILFHFWNKTGKIKQKIQSNQRLLQSVSNVCQPKLIKQAINKYIMQLYIGKLIDLLSLNSCYDFFKVNQPLMSNGKFRTIKKSCFLNQENNDRNHKIILHPKYFEVN